tara:strand:- start:49 stop:378 length:330 start_codon:yes stop_codon:yes gene_type:complete
MPSFKENRGFKMNPGDGSQVNPGNFKQPEVMKYSPFMYNPTLTDMSGDNQVTRKDFLIKVGAKGFEKGMDKKKVNLYQEKNPNPMEYGRPMNYKKGYPSMEIKNPTKHH